MSAAAFLLHGAAPAVAPAAAVAFGSSGSATISQPTPAYAAGDFLLAIGFTGGSAATEIGIPSTWTSITGLSLFGGANSLAGRVVAKPATTAGSDTMGSFPNTGMRTISAAYRGADTATPIGARAALEGPAGTSIQYPALAGTFPASRVILIGCTRNDYGPGTPPGFSLMRDSTSSAAASVRWFQSDEPLTSFAGLTVPNVMGATVRTSDSGHAAFVFALNEAPPPAPPASLLTANLWENRGYQGISISNPAPGVLRLRRLSGSAGKPVVSLINVSAANVMVRARMRVYGFLTGADQARWGPAGRCSGTSGSLTDTNAIFYAQRRLSTDDFLFRPYEIVAGTTGASGASDNVTDTAYFEQTVDMEITLNGSAVSTRYKLASSETWITGNAYTTASALPAGSVGFAAGSAPDTLTCDITDFSYTVL